MKQAEKFKYLGCIISNGERPLKKEKINQNKASEMGVTTKEKTMYIKKCIDIKTRKRLTETYMWSIQHYTKTWSMLKRFGAAVKWRKNGQKGR